MSRVIQYVKVELYPSIDIQVHEGEKYYYSVFPAVTDQDIIDSVYNLAYRLGGNGFMQFKIRNVYKTKYAYFKAIVLTGIEVTGYVIKRAK